MVTIKYSRISLSAGRYYREHVFVAGDQTKPTFMEWMASQGGTLVHKTIEEESERGENSAEWVVTFADETDATLFMLKWQLT